MTPSTAPADLEPPRRPLARILQPSWGGVIGLFVVTAGWVIGLRPLADNSFLTHLATGRLIIDTGRVPSVDPYTFTAAGEPWVVQSWLASLAYATAEQLGGLDGVRLLTGAIAATLAGLGWALLRPAGGVLVRLSAAALFIVVGAGMWAERPFMIGLICLALLALAMEGRVDPRWLLPIGWVWVNTHGSFPLGIVLLVVAGVGRRLDGESPEVELRCLRWAVPGMVLGAVGPLGPKVLFFPLELLQRQDLLSQVVEWRAPTFDTTSQRMFIVQLALAVVLIARRPSYRGALLIGVFGGMALLGSRNLAVASLVLLPVMAPALAGVGSMGSADRARPARLAGIGAVAMLLLLTVARSNQAPLELRKYPIGALVYLEEAEIDTREVRMVAPDYVGNLLDFVYGPERRTFYDDRFDMFPDDISRAQIAVNLGTPAMRVELDRLDIDLAVMKTASATGQVLVTDADWRVLYLDDAWTLLCRRGAPLSAAGTC